MPKPRATCRLRNGAVHFQDSVAATVRSVRWLAQEQPHSFKDLAAALRSGSFDDLPDHLVAWCKRECLADAGKAGLTLYDDVKDVLECLVEWRGSAPALRPSPLSGDQKDLEAAV